MNRTTCGVIRSCLSQDLKCDVMNETSAKKIWETLESKYLTKSVENCLHLKRRFYRFQLKKGVKVHLEGANRCSANLIWNCNNLKWMVQTVNLNQEVEPAFQ